MLRAFLLEVGLFEGLGRKQQKVTATVIATATATATAIATAATVKLCALGLTVACSLGLARPDRLGRKLPLLPAGRSQ